MPDHFEQMWARSEPVGRAAASGGYFRQPFASAERELDAWFVEQAPARGLRLETDPFGNGSPGGIPGSPRRWLQIRRVSHRR